jgi:phage gp29-like protein
MTPQPLIYRWDRLGYVELRFEDLISIIEDAQRGDPKRWADLTRRMVETDPDLAAVVGTRLDGVCASRWELSPPDGSGDEALAKIAAELCTHALRSMLSFEQVQRDLLDGIGQGYAAGELIWERQQVTLSGKRYGVWLPTRIEPVHPRRFVFSDSFELALRDDYATHGLGGERIQTRAGMAIRLPRDKYIVHQPRQVLDYPTSTGLFLTVARYWWVKQWVLRYYLSGAERSANGRWLGKYPQNAPAAIKEALFEALESIAGDGIGVMADTTSTEEVGGDFTGAAQVWEGLVSLCDRGYAKAWLGSTLNTDVGDSGSRALGESQASTTIDPRRERDSRALWADIRRFVLEPICRFNALDALGPFAGRMPPVPVGRHVFAEDPVEVDDLLVDVGGATVNDVRVSRGQPAWSDPRGEAIAVKASNAPAWQQPQQPQAAPIAPEVSAAAEPPFPAWELAQRIARGWQMRTPTSTPSPTNPSSSEPSR